MSDPSSLPKTPPLSRKLFHLSETSKIPAPITAEEKACETDNFHTIVSRIVNQAVPKETLLNIDTELKQFFDDIGVENENGFSLLKEVDFPTRNTSKSNYVWNNIVFRKALAVVAEASVTYKLLPNTDYQLLNQQLRTSKNVSPVPPTTITTTTTVEKYKLESAAKVELETFSGFSTDYKDWNDSVHTSYGVCGMNDFLKDDSLCNRHMEVSKSIKFNLCKALGGGHLSYLVEEYKGEMNAAVFYKKIEDTANETTDQRIREFQAWWHLFTHSLNSNKDYQPFINNYNKSVNTLRIAKSKGVDDDILLRALLIRAIQCDEFEDVKTDAMKDLNMTPKSILDELKKTHQAIKSNESLGDFSSGGSPSKSKIVRRAGKGNDDKNNDSNSSDKNKSFRNAYIPNWPQGFKEVCTDSLWNQLSVWKSLVNKQSRTPAEKERLKNFTINVKQSQSSYDGGRDRKRGRSSKSNRHTSDRRRSSRRSNKKGRSRSPSISQSDGDYTSDYDSSASERDTKRSRRGSKRDTKDTQKEITRDRSTAAIMAGGILKKRS